MLVLGIETSGTVGSVALLEDGNLLGERTLAGKGLRHAQMLTAEMAILFQESQRTAGDCDGVAVSVGPGSFTGLRIGVVCAKTFAYAVGCPLAAVDTLQAIAQECPNDLPSVTVLADAQRGDLYVGRYAKIENQWVREGSISIHPALEFCRSLSSKDTVTGPALNRWHAEIPSDCNLISGIHVPRASTVCELGTGQLLEGVTADAWRVEPYYLRKSSAEEQWERRHNPS